MRTYTYKQVVFSLIGVGLAIYGAFLFKKGWIDKGFPNEEVEKEVLLGNYCIMMGLENNKQNRDKFRKMSLDELKKAFNVNQP